MKPLRMKASALLIFTVGCSSAVIERNPSVVTNTSVKFVEASASEELVLDRKFLTSEPVQDVRVCGELLRVDKDYFILSRCPQEKTSGSFYGLSKIPRDYLLPEAQGSAWLDWTQSAETKTKVTGTKLAPFICILGRGNGDPCNKINGSLVQRVRRFTSDEEQFKSW